MTKLAPAHICGLAVGVWFLSISVGDYIGGRLASVYETFPLPQLFRNYRRLLHRCRIAARVPAASDETPDGRRELMSELSGQYREQFPVTKNLVYLNHAAVAPLSRRAAEAMQWLAQGCSRFRQRALPSNGWIAIEGVRTAAARMINATPAEIAIVKNTSEGIATVAIGIDWKHGDIVVAFDEEFPANLYPWQRLAAKGVEIRWLSIFDDLARIDEAAKGARLLAISYVQYLSGYRVNLDQLGEICQRRGCFFFVDAIQGMGAFPIDVRSSHIDALSADGHKWMLGTRGLRGALRVSRGPGSDRPGRVRMDERGEIRRLHIIARHEPAAGRRGRYECGTMNTIPAASDCAPRSICAAPEAGVENVSAAVQQLGDRLWHGAQEHGFETLGKRDHATGAGIVSIRKPGSRKPVHCAES